MGQQITKTEMDIERETIEEVEAEQRDDMGELEDALDGEGEETEEAVAQERVVITKPNETSRIDIKIDRAEGIKQFFQSLAKITDETLLNITKDGFSSMRMSPSSISMIRVFMPNRNFSRFSVAENVSLGISTANTNKLLSVFDKTDSLRIEEFGTKIRFTGTNENGKKVLTLPLIDIKDNALKEPVIDFKAVAEINGKELEKAFKDASYVSSYLSFRMINNGGNQELWLSSKGDGGEYNKLYERDNGLGKAFISGKEVLATYNLDELSKFLKATDKNTKVEIRYSTGEPLKVSYTAKEINYSFYLAPYMNEDDTPDTETKTAEAQTEAEGTEEEGEAEVIEASEGEEQEE